MSERIEERVARLERRLAARGRVSVVLLALCAVLGTIVVWRDAAAGPEAAVPDVVRAKRFELVDAKGKVLAVLGDYSGPHLALMGADEKVPVVDMGVTPGGDAQLVMNGPPGKGLVIHRVNRYGPSIEFLMGAELRAKVGMGPQGHALLSLLDPKRQERVIVASDPDGTPRLELLDKDGKVVWSAPPK